MANTQKVQFPNPSGQSLAAALTAPDGPARGTVLFAHCFSCGKDVSAAARIARALAGNGFAVLRFDFTGLGGSEGDFANTDFQSNVNDLLAAADYLRAHHTAPVLLMGHSLGGTAVLAAAGRIAECRAVTTIGAPATPAHLLSHFADSRERIETEGAAEVTIAGRRFLIRREFLEDLERHPLTDQVARLRRALLIFHAPLDDVVSVDEAGRIFAAAKHPKSFLSLDGADHLLSRAADARYVADTVSAWVQRYLPKEPPGARPQVDRGEVLVEEADRRFLREVFSDSHRWLADEPRAMGGGDLGPDPYEHLLAALGTCTSMTIRLYANRKGWPLEDVVVTTSHAREHVKDCEDCDESGERIERLRRRIHLRGALTAEQHDRLLEIADRCPVHRTLEGDLIIDTERSES
jgi:putative redox protein